MIGSLSKKIESTCRSIHQLMHTIRDGDSVDKRKASAEISCLAMEFTDLIESLEGRTPTYPVEGRWGERAE